MREVLSIFKNGDWLAWNYSQSLQEYVRQRGGRAILSADDLPAIKRLQPVTSAEESERDEALKLLSEHGELEFRLIQDMQT